MQQPVERPIGVTLLAALVAIKGIASLAMATELAILDLARSTHADEPAAGVAVVVGLLLLYKAHGLWKLHRRAWTMMILLLAIETTAAVWELLNGTRTVTVWVSLFLDVAIGLYLFRPSVRALFWADHAD